MKKLIATTLILLSHSAFSDITNTPQSVWAKIGGKLGIEKDFSIKIKDGRYVMYGPAHEKRQALEELSQWSKKPISGNFSLEKPLIVDSILPDTVSENIYSRHLLNGPNCHNNSLITLGIMNKRMYVGDKEFKKNLEVFCQETDAPSTEALGVVYSNNGTAFHSYITIGSDIKFDKVNVRGDLFPRFKKSSKDELDNSVFYNCSKRHRVMKTITRTCSKNVLELSKKLEALHKKTSRLAMSLAGAKERFQNKQVAYELESEIFRDDTCPKYQELLEARIDSILSFYTELEMTGGIYGKTTYDRGPRI